jgi:hypothetical protein
MFIRHPLAEVDVAPTRQQVSLSTRPSVFRYADADRVLAPFTKLGGLIHEYRLVA